LLPKGLLTIIPIMIANRLINIIFAALLAVLSSRMVVHASKFTMSCAEAVDKGLLDEPTSPFPGYPCGTTDFNTVFVPETLGCVYNTKFDEYECTLESNPAPDVVAAVMETFSEDNTQPCTVPGYSLDGNVKTWWWLCVKD
jgi:hypothetical protein